MKTAVMISNLRFGGAEVQTVELVNNLKARGLDVLLIIMENDLAIRERLSPGIEPVVLGKRRYADPAMLRRLRKVLQEYRPEILLTVNSYPTLYGYIARRMTGLHYKILCVQHTTLYQGLADSLQNCYYMPMLRRLDRIVFVSGNQKEHWLRKYRIPAQKASVVYNGIDIGRFEGFQADPGAIRQELGFSAEDIVIGISANLRPEKKHEDLVDAVKILLSRGYAVKLLIIGDGVRRESVEQHIRAAGMESSVAITGFIQDVRPYLACTDIVALSSVAVETLSIAVIEAMALAKPVVLSNIGGASELVEEGVNGYLYEAGKVEQLAASLQQLIDSRQGRAMGQQSLEKARRLFDREEMVNRYLELMEQLS